MILVNKNHPAIISHKVGISFVSFVGEKDIYFSSQACIEYGLQGGKYLHFINDEQNWYFFQNDDSDGFLLHADGKESSSAARITNKALMRMILKTHPRYTPPVKFFIQRTGMQRSCSPVFEILMNKTYDELIENI